ncbi:hypothetical protein BUALT_Bualt02G0085500 [Buddleja alternifolia]|uniref:NB-ARC domain-containing protein n=1 Tax=Buddleja alternifolia TaxID=168488 RepID=A0AAV6XYK9_9LAMI|nr:hypothetical protein BUALT_Bualt02G0085500 [Buddleja alternifolia]
MTNPFIVNHFDTCAWITISHEYNLQEILLCLLDCTADLTDEMRKESNDKLALRLHKSLKDRRYLVVTDDVWSTKAWDDINMLFPNDNNGSRIMLTTKLSNIACYVDSFSSHHQMHFLNEDESWKLLQKKVFLEEHCPSDLQEIGKEIAKNCKGLPLTIAVIGGLLSNHNRTKDFWEHVAENMSSIITNNDEQCLKILSLSYNYLALHLRPYYLYMGAFPEDYDIRVSKLIKLWVAEGFFKPIKSKSMDEVAMESFQDLIDQNLILVRQQGSNGKTKSCSIHDLLRDLCVREGHRENFLWVVKSAATTSLDDTNCQRRLIVHANYLKVYDPSSSLFGAINDSLKSMSVARSFLGIGHFGNQSLYLGFRLLRVLDVTDVEFSHFPEEVLELYNLRNLAFTSKSKLPSSISMLKNLQTLIVHQGEVWRPIEGEFLQLKYLKLEMMDLVHWETDDTHFPSLQHLILKKCRQLKEIHSAIGEILMLQLIQLDDCSLDAVTSANNLRQEQVGIRNYSIEVRITFTKEVRPLRKVGSSGQSPITALQMWMQKALLKSDTTVADVVEENGDPGSEEEAARVKPWHVYARRGKKMAV